MKLISGFVWIAKLELAEILFGEGESDTQRYLNIETNNLLPFTTKEAAYRALPHLQKRADIHRLTLASIKMRVAETKKDLGILSSSRSLVVVMMADGDMRLLGNLVEGRPSAYPMPGAYLRYNGLKPFKKFQDAEYSARQVRRQAACLVTMADLKLKRL